MNEAELVLPVAADISDELRNIVPEPPSRLHHFVERSADAAQGDALAAVSAGEQLTYADLELHANRLAHSLIARGAGPGRTVGILRQL